ncbi:Fur family transcriptional regulator [Granulicella arctica]|uniref:Fur family ferric uptake transcriptional regulator n=1 Tax=Granulicella arctica TaxID=940613 RepID=A0A7Y9PD86_9BACT|nr:transcriptional repressor [Granulicella arctica]NYF77797.1 Fur family ferric uptake transcriptional regulator [Granulicella arctica]
MPIQIRKTRQKDAIRTAFLEADRPLSPDEALQEAQKLVEGVSVATVYRNINSLLEDKWLVPIDLPGQAARYEVAGKEHHHHFQCTVCMKTYELSGCALQVKPKLPRGFKATGHEFFVYGTCVDCS